MGMPAANIATVVMATTVHPNRELGCPCIIDHSANPPTIQVGVLYESND
jgi:hypothetical protein